MLFVSLMAWGCVTGVRGPSISDSSLLTGLWDAHTHLSIYGADALDSLHGAGVVGVRDLGANNLDEILQWRSEIVTGKRKGPRIHTAGVILDGPKDDSANRWTIRNGREAERAV